MDNAHISYAQDAGSQDSLEEDVWSSPVKAAASRFLSTLRSNTVNVLRPYVSQIVPLAVYLALAPLILFLSGIAGFLVWRTIAVSWKTPLYLQFGDGRQPHADVSLPALHANQAYDFAIHLVVPAVESNLALGNFMTALTLTTASNQTLVSERRPTIAFPPQSSLPSFFRPRRTVYSLVIPMISNYAPGTSHVLAQVEIGRRDNWKSLGTGEGRELNILNASIEGTIVHSGLRGLITRYPLTCSLISAGAFAIILFSILAFCIVVPALRNLSVPEDPLGAMSEESSRSLKEEEDEEDGRAYKRQRMSSRRRGAGRALIESRVGSSVFASSRSKSDSLRRRKRIPQELLSDLEDEPGSQDF